MKVIMLAIFLALTTSSASAMLVSSDPFGERDVVLVGNITSATPDYDSGKTTYTARVEEMLKGWNLLTLGNKTESIEFVSPGISGYNGEPHYIYDKIFQVGERALLMLDEENGVLNESLWSRTTESDCSGKEILALGYAPGGMRFTQRGADHPPFYTNIPFDAKYYYFNRDLQNKTVTVSFNITYDWPNWITKNVTVSLKKCQAYAEASTQFVIPEAGKFAINVSDSEGGGEGFSGTQVINYVAPPLQQIRSGTPINDIQCMEGLVKVVRASDGSPACVRPETKQRLLEIGWAKDSTAKDCNDIDAKKEAQCLVDAFNSCEQAFANEVSYTVEGDPTYIETTIAKDCKIHVSHDISEDRFGGYEKDIYYYTCSKISIEKDEALKISSCQEPNTLYIGFREQDSASEVECTKMNGTWSYEYHNCYGIDKDQCQVAGGMQSCMGYDQMGNGRDVCKMVCEMQPQDRK